jgi:ParB family chromosome partitioning protein
MGSDAKKAFNAEGRDELLKFDPFKLTIVEDEGNPLADERARLNVPEWLVASMIKHGNIVPITVRLNGKSPDGTPRVEVVDGRQRVRAARLASERVRALGEGIIMVYGVRKRGDDDTMFAQKIVANEHRQETPPMMKAREAGRALARGMSISEIAQMYRVQNQTIQQWLALLELAKPVQEAVDKHEIAASTAVAFFSGKLPREEQAAALEKMRADGTLKGQAAIAAAEKLSGSARGKTGDEAAIAQIPSRTWLKRLAAELEGSSAFAEGGHPASEATGALAVLRLLLEGKQPRGNAVAKAWRDVQKRFSRGKDTPAAE